MYLLASVERQNLHLATEPAVLLTSTNQSLKAGSFSHADRNFWVYCRFDIFFKIQLNIRDTKVFSKLRLCTLEFYKCILLL
jgi:hypothetical protein